MQRLWQRLTPLYQPHEAQAVVRWLLGEVFQLSLADVLTGGVEALGSADRALLEQLMQRLEQGEPVQYVVGHEWFGNRCFKVAPGVLIPRPETFELCQHVARKLQKSQVAGPQILDVGTGNGCIAISLALDVPQAHVMALDISDAALSIARENALKLGATVNFKKADALRLPTDAEPRWHAIVSNPPYITPVEERNMHINVKRYEPRKALFVPGSDPLLFYRSIAHYALKALYVGGWLAFEVNSLFADAVAAMLQQLGFNAVEILTDQFGNHRFVICQNK